MKECIGEVICSYVHLIASTQTVVYIATSYITHSPVAVRSHLKLTYLFVITFEDSC